MFENIEVKIKNSYLIPFLSNLYEEPIILPECHKAHQANDHAVMQAYGFDVKTMTESTCVAELMKMYQNLIK